MINTIARKQIFLNDTVVPAPEPARRQQQPATSNTAPVTASGQEHGQVNADTQAPVDAADHKQPNTAMPTAIVRSGRKQLKNPPVAAPGQAEPDTSKPPPPIHAWN